MLGIVAGIAMFMFLVLIHEIWHYIAAKKSWVSVLEFGIGIPPKVCTLRKDKDGTAYTLNRIPLGGFVRLKGEQPDDEGGLTAKTSFLQATLGRKLLILVAGVAVNALFAWLAFSLAFWKGVPPLFVVPDNMLSYESKSYLLPSAHFLQEEWFLSGGEMPTEVVINEVNTWWLAAQAGVKPWDRWLALDGEQVNGTMLSRQLRAFAGKSFTLTYERDGATGSATITCPEDNCFLGVVLSGGTLQHILPIKFPLGKSILAGGHEVIEQTRVTFLMLWWLFKNIFSGDKEKMSTAVGKMSWPVGIVKFGEMIFAEWGIWLYLAFAGMISLALAVFNILPIPALDGGRALSVCIQVLGRFKPSAYFAVEQYINLVFFILLMAMGIFIILQDLQRFWGVSLPRWGG